MQLTLPTPVADLDTVGSELTVEELYTRRLFDVSDVVNADWSGVPNLDPYKVKDIIIHCTDTSCSTGIGVQDIHRWHLARNWKGCGYHYVITADGQIQRGRPIYYEGAHCIGHNKSSVGIAYVGGRDAYGIPKDTRTFEQKIAIAYCITNYVLPYYPHIERILGHNDYTNKTCPNFDAKFEYRNFLTNIINRIKIL